MKESNKRNPKLWKAVLRCFWFHIFLASVVVFIDITACTLRPILLRQLLMDINDLKITFISLLAFCSKYQTFGLLHYIWFAPTQIIVVFWLMGRIALIPSLCALIATILNIPFGFACNAFYSKFRFSAAKHTANRIRLLSDMIKGMKTIKVQVWEDIFSKLIGSVRRKLRPSTALKATSTADVSSSWDYLNRLERFLIACVLL
ncbi:unnamed protein product [Heterobilharzia americana]|nr:unnamed protein product [Heterobilharzia americana]